MGRAGECPATTDLHAGNSLLPARNESREGEGDGLTPRPRAIEFFTRFVVHTEVVNFDRGTRLGFIARAQLEVVHDELTRSGLHGRVNFGFALCHNALLIVVKRVVAPRLR
jgi:hypothetical protein